jgi:hypothetical protein
MKPIPPILKKNYHISLVTIFVLLMVTSIPVSAASLGSMSGSGTAVLSQLNLYANIETMGVVVSGTDLPKTAQLMYRKSGDSAWRTGHPLVQIDDGRLVGSLFWLMAPTSYDVKVVDGSAEIAGSATTQPNDLQFTPKNIIHVNDDAPAGGDGSAAAPFRTIQEGVNNAGAGTQVLVADGVYHEAVTFPASGTADNWIQVKAEGSGAVLDGSDQLTGKVWTPHATKANVWFTKIGSSIAYLARDRKRFFKYDDLSGLLQGVGHNNVYMNEGWYFEQSTLRLYVRSLDDPSGHSWQVPTLNHAFDVIGQDWIWIEGFEIRFYGTTTNGCGVCTVNASHVVVRGNKIHNLQLGVFINWTGGEDRGNDSRVEFNEVYDPPVNEWPWDAVKGSSMEGTGIIVRGHIGAIVRDNEVHHFFNGIYTGSSGALENPALAFDADIYNNYIHHISDDGLEPEGACINQRFRNNTVDTMLIGVSLAPITQGPTWVLRSSFTNFTSSPIKWASKPDGLVFFYHNTSWTNAKSLNAMSMITPIKNTVMRNNIFQGNGYAFEEPFTGSTGNDWNYDNWYTTRGSSGPRFKWENVNYATMPALCTGTRLECNGHESLPGLTNPARGDFTLLSSSPNLDRGILIPGINDDFGGKAPDIGAYEFSPASFPTVSSIARMDPNPTDAGTVRFSVSFSEKVRGVDVSDFALVASGGVSGATVGAVTGLGSVFTVTVNTGVGNGTLRLDLSDNDSITNTLGRPLGGAGTGNGTFRAGEEYTIKRIQVNTITEVFKSNGAYDGWILESGESTNAGGKFDKSATVINVGDDARDRQYRSFLSFNTGSLPDNAVITYVEVKVRKQGVTGTDPFATHGVLLLEIRNTAFSNNAALQLIDFSAPASSGAVPEQLVLLGSGWCTTTLQAGNLNFINKYGVTQFRLRFSKDDNDDMGADYMKFFSGNSTSSNQPQLIVSYYIP